MSPTISLCTIFVDPATLFIPVNVFPMLPIYRRNRTLEGLFSFGIYDTGINILKDLGEYPDFSSWPPNPPLDIHGNWTWFIPDYPWDVLRKCKKNHRTPDDCLRDTDENIARFFKRDSGLPVVQYLFGNADSLKVRIKSFLKQYDTAVFGIGNTCKLRSIKKQYAIGEVIVELSNRFQLEPHILGCPTRLLDYLITNMKVPFSADTNKFCYRHKHWSRNKVERSLFLHEFLIERAEKIKKRRWKQTTLF